MPPADLPEITDVKRLTIRPGDRIVVRLDHDLRDDAQFGEIRRRLAELFDGLPYVPPIIVLGPDMDLEVIGPDAPGLAGKTAAAAALAGAGFDPDDVRKAVGPEADGA